MIMKKTKTKPEKTIDTANNEEEKEAAYKSVKAKLLKIYNKLKEAGIEIAPVTDLTVGIHLYLAKHELMCPSPQHEHKFELHVRDFHSHDPKEHGTFYLSCPNCPAVFYLDVAIIEKFMLKECLCSMGEKGLKKINNG